MEPGSEFSLTQTGMPSRISTFSVMGEAHAPNSIEIQSKVIIPASKKKCIRFKSTIVITHQIIIKMETMKSMEDRMGARHSSPTIRGANLKAKGRINKRYMMGYLPQFFLHFLSNIT